MDEEELNGYVIKHILKEGFSEYRTDTITDEEANILIKFSNTLKDEDLSTVYVINDLRFYLFKRDNNGQAQIY